MSGCVFAGVMLYGLMQSSIASNAGLAAYRPTPETVVCYADSPWYLRPDRKCFRSRAGGAGPQVPRRQLLLSPIYDVCSCSRWGGGSKGTFQMSWAYSPMVRSEENQAIRAILSMLARVQSEVDSHSSSTLLCVAQ